MVTSQSLPSGLGSRIGFHRVPLRPQFLGACSTRSLPSRPADRTYNSGVRTVTLDSQALSATPTGPMGLRGGKQQLVCRCVTVNGKSRRLVRRLALSPRYLRHVNYLIQSNHYAFFLLIAPRAVTARWPPAAINPSKPLQCGRQLWPPDLGTGRSAYIPRPVGCLKNNGRRGRPRRRTARAHDSCARLLLLLIRQIFTFTFILFHSLSLHFANSKSGYYPPRYPHRTHILVKLEPRA